MHLGQLWELARELRGYNEIQLARALVDVQKLLERSDLTPIERRDAAQRLDMVRCAREIAECKATS